MLEQLLLVLISAVTATIGAVCGGFIISKRLKNDLKAEFYEFINGEDAPKLFYAIGNTLGAGAMSRFKGLNPMKGNVNIMGVKIPKVIAFGIAQKYGLLPKGTLTGQTVEEEAPPFPSASKVLEGMK